jgi:hypothetical protein
MRLAYDIETDGLFDAMTHIKCLNVIEIDTEVEYRFTDWTHYECAMTGERTEVPTERTGTLAEGLAMLAEADEIVAHNGAGFDDPAICMLFPDWEPTSYRRDSKLEAQIVWSDLKVRDSINAKRGKLPAEFKAKRFIGSHKLEAWGYRLGAPKGDFVPTKMVRWIDGMPCGKWSWEEYPFSKECDDYCMQDVRTLVQLVKRIEAHTVPVEAARMEYLVRQVVDRQENTGFVFNENSAMALVAKLQARSAELTDELQEMVPPWLAPKGRPKRTKRDRRQFVQSELGGTTRKVKGETQRGYWSYWTGGEKYQSIEPKVFNPGSRDQIANRLIKLEGWVPTDFTSDGKASVSEDILDTLEYPIARKLSEYLMVAKRLGQLADGKQGWLKHVKRDGRIHGRVDTLGCITSRMSHSYPNIGQVPTTHKPYGKECRELFTVPQGKVLVGCDAEGIELRLLAHYMARYDGGRYARTVVEGRKEDGTDAHTVNQSALQLRLRDSAKTWFYAFIYGAGAYKLGTIVLADFTEEKRAKFYSKFPVGNKRNRALVRLGVRSKERLAKNLPALSDLTDDVKKAAKRGWLKALDGRLLRVRSEHAALNTLLQGGGAIIMKRALVIMTAAVYGLDGEFVANVHDEVQIESLPENADEIGRLAADAIRKAGEFYELRCPLAGDYAVGGTWAETH